MIFLLSSMDKITAAIHKINTNVSIAILHRYVGRDYRLTTGCDIGVSERLIYCVDENPLRGRENWNLLPMPSSLSTRMVPPCSSTKRWVMANPKPVPPE